MYNIGICDDGKAFCGSMENMILTYAKEHDIRMDVEVWYSGEELCDALKKGTDLDVLFLDIELLERKGMEVARFIRNEMGNRGMQIVYVSAKTSYAQELFKTQPMDFLIKPIGQSQIEEALNLAFEIIRKDEVKFTFQNGREYYAVPFGDIMYFCSEGRKIILVTQDGEKRFYGRLKDFAEKLPSEFVAIHQSYIVNKKYIVQFGYEAVILSNGDTLPISKSKRREVRQKILKGDEWI